MNRLLAALLLSFALHFLIFLSDFEISAKQKDLVRVPRHLTVTLSSRPASAPVSLLDPKPGEAPVIKPRPIPRVIKPMPAKVEQPVREKPVKAIPETPLPEPVPKPVLSSDATALVAAESSREPDAAQAEAPAPAAPVAVEASAAENKTLIASGPPMTLREARPAYRKNPPPPYPGSAKRRGIEGTVLLEVYVNSSGKADKVSVFKSSGYTILDQAALAALRSWVFEPGMLGERPVGMWVRVPIRFELR